MQSALNEQLVRQVRASFVIKGTSFAEFCRSINVDNGNAVKALSGSWNGKKGQEVRAKILAEANIEIDDIESGDKKG